MKLTILPLIIKASLERASGDGGAKGLECMLSSLNKKKEKKKKALSIYLFVPLPFDPFDPIHGAPYVRQPISHTLHLELPNYRVACSARPSRLSNRPNDSPHHSPCV